MKILLDNNVILDALLDRPPFNKHAKCLLELLASYTYEGWVASKSVTDLYYILRRSCNPDTNMTKAECAKSALGSFLCLVSIAPTTEEDIHNAFSLPIRDFEDAVITSVAEAIAAQYIVTNNTKHFLHSPIPAISSEDFLNIVLNTNSAPGITHYFSKIT